MPSGWSVTRDIFHMRGEIRLKKEGELSFTHLKGSVLDFFTAITESSTDLNRSYAMLQTLFFKLQRLGGVGWDIKGELGES